MPLALWACDSLHASSIILRWGGEQHACPRRMCGCRLLHYMTRCPFSLSQLVQVTKTGQVIYKAEKDACWALPDPQGDGLVSGPQRKFPILSPLELD
jgi:hypothetical protein